MSRYKVGDIVMFDKEVLRIAKCWSCMYRGRYEWRRSGWFQGQRQEIQHSKKLYCNKTKRWGSPDRAYFCPKFEHR